MKIRFSNIYFYIYLRNLAINKNNSSVTTPVLDTFYVKNCVVQAKYLKIYLNFELILLHISLGFYATKINLNLGISKYSNVFKKNELFHCAP